MKDVKSIMKLLESHPRNFLLFVMGVNNGLRTDDLLKLKVGQVRNLKSGQSLKIREGKTKKENILMVNKIIFKAIQKFIEAHDPEDDEFLFQSRKGKNIPLQTTAVNRLIKKWTREINLKGRYGAHTLRKTWGYHQRKTFGVAIELITKRYNHSSPSITMRYLGIEDKEVNNILMNEIG